jgi:hypothetical protein
MIQCDQVFLVGGQGLLPSDPSDAFLPGLRFVYGCNHLGCTNCEQDVRHSTKDDRRLYSCGCTEREVTTGLSITDNHDEWDLPPWRCLGHPVSDLPFAVDDLTIDKGSDLEHLASRILSRPILRDRPHGLTPSRRLAYVYLRLKYSRDGQELAASLCESLIGLMRNGKAIEKSGVISFFTEMADAPQAAALVSLASGPPLPDLLESNPIADGTLEDALFFFVFQRVLIGDLEARRFAREASLRGDPRLLRALVMKDVRWVIEHLSSIVQARPAAAEAVLDVLKASGSSHLGEVAVRLSWIPMLRHSEVVRELSSRSFSDSIRQRIHAVTMHGGVIEVDGIAFSPATDFVKLVRHHLEGRGPRPSAQPGARPIQWLLKVADSLSFTPLHDRLSEAIAACLTAADNKIQSQALHYFQKSPRALGHDRILDLLRGDRAPFVGVPDPFNTDRTLEWQLLAALSYQLTSDQHKAIELARKEVLIPGKAGPLVAALTSQDTPWVLTHAREIVAGTPSAAVAILFRLCYLGKEYVALGRELAPLAAIDPRFEEDLRAFINDPVAVDAILSAATL